MRTRAVVLLAGLALAPAAALAQAPPGLPSARLTITPLLGVRASLIANGTTTVVVPGGGGPGDDIVFPVVVDFEREREAGALTGLEADLRIAGRVGVAGAVLYTNADPLLVTREVGSGVVTQLRVDGPSVWLARLGLSYRLPELEGKRGAPFPAGFLLVGPAAVRQDYWGTLLELGDEPTVDSWAVHFGYRGQFPIGVSGLAFQLSVEDYVPLWNRRGERVRVERLLDLEPGTVLTSDLRYGATHIPVFQTGIAFRF